MNASHKYFSRIMQQPRWSIVTPRDTLLPFSVTIGLRIFVCENRAFHGEYTPVLAKHFGRISLPSDANPAGHQITLKTVWAVP